jgi:hypothetical protein
MMPAADLARHHIGRDARSARDESANRGESLLGLGPGNLDRIRRVGVSFEVRHVHNAVAQQVGLPRVQLTGVVT